MRVIIKAGKHEGLIGTVVSVDHGWHCVMVGGSDEVRVRSKDIEIYSGDEGNPASMEGQNVSIKTGKHKGQSGFVRSVQANGWYTIDVGGTTTSMRMADFEVSGKRTKIMDVAQKVDSNIQAGKNVVLIGGPNDGKVGAVSKVLNSSWFIVELSTGDEVRLRRSEFREVDDELTETAEGSSGEGEGGVPTQWYRIKAGKHKGHRGRVIEASPTWMHLQLENESVKVRPSECELEEDTLMQSDDEAVLEVGSTVRVLTGDATGKVGQIMKTGHGWINVKIGDEDVRVRSKDIEAVGREADGNDLSPAPKSKVTVKTGKYRGQGGKVLSSGHGWLWVKIGAEEIRVRRRDVAVSK